MFLIIKGDLFNTFLNSVGSNLTQANDMYVITLILTNMLAYLIIFLTIKIGLYLYNNFLSRDFRKNY